MDEGFELMFDDLTPEAQERLLEFMGESVGEMNWNVFPITTIYRTED